MLSLLPKRHRRLLFVAIILVIAALLIPSEKKAVSASQRQSIDLSAKTTNTQQATPIAAPNTSEPSLEKLQLTETQRVATPQVQENKAKPVAPAEELADTPVAVTFAIQQEAKPEQSSEIASTNIAAANEIAEASNQPSALTQAGSAADNSVKVSDAAELIAQLQQGKELNLGVRYPLQLEIEPQQALEEPEHFYTLKRQTVKSGDSMALIFSRVGLSARTLHDIDQLGGEARKLRTVHPGDTLDFYLDDQDRLMELHYPQSKFQTLIIERDKQDSFAVKVDTQELEVRTNFAQGTINSSFWNAGIGAQLSQGQIMALAAIFGWDIDFALDIRKNDSFMVLFEEHFVDGQFAGNGDIIAAEFINQGDVFRAVRHADGNYYTPEGRPMRKAFLRAPVNFKYISSSFNPRRLHPVTGRVRAHNGIDYAAKVGTPVQAAGDGRVTKSGYSKYNGNYVFIQHSSAYVTKYLHLHKRYVKTGQRVKQGKRIGSVGATGRVTGPHLHYEFLVHGVHKNPRTVKLPTSTPLKGKQKEIFMPIAKARIKQLDNTKRVLLAMN